jgi:hypothetical protein
MATLLFIGIIALVVWLIYITDGFIIPVTVILAAFGLGIFYVLCIIAFVVRLLTGSFPWPFGFLGQ